MASNCTFSWYREDLEVTTHSLEVYVYGASSSSSGLHSGRRDVAEWSLDMNSFVYVFGAHPSIAVRFLTESLFSVTTPSNSTSGTPSLSGIGSLPTNAGSTSRVRSTLR